MLGWWPMAKKRPPASISRSWPAALSCTRTPASNWSPSTSTSSVCQEMLILSFSRTRCCMVLEARIMSRRTSMVTEEP